MHRRCYEINNHKRILTNENQAIEFNQFMRSFKMEYISQPNLLIYFLLSKFQPYISLTQNPIAINPSKEIKQ